MKKIGKLIGLLLLTTTLASAQSQHFGMDAAHSQVKFIGVLGDMMEVEGVFGNIWGDVLYDDQNPENLSVTVVIESASLRTDNDWRDKHLTNPEFLDTAQYEIIRFTSKSVSATEISGDLTIKGETYAITSPYEKTVGPAPDPWGNNRVTFKGTFAFSRGAYNLGPTGGFWGNSISDEARIEFTFSFTRQNMDRMTSLNQEKPASVFNAFMSEGAAAGLAKLEEVKQGATRPLSPVLVDFLAKKLRQYDNPESYLAILKQNTEYFPETDWVWANYALGLWEQNMAKDARELAQKVLEMNPKNSLAMELVK